MALAESGKLLASQAAAKDKTGSWPVLSLLGVVFVAWMQSGCRSEDKPGLHPGYTASSRSEFIRDAGALGVGCVWRINPLLQRLIVSARRVCRANRQFVARMQSGEALSASLELHPDDPRAALACYPLPLAGEGPGGEGDESQPRSVCTARPGKSVMMLSAPKSARRRISAASFTVHTDTCSPCFCALSRRSGVHSVQFRASRWQS